MHPRVSHICYLKAFLCRRMSYSLNSLKGGYIGDYIGDYYGGYSGGY